MGMMKMTSYNYNRVQISLDFVLHYTGSFYKSAYPRLDPLFKAIRAILDTDQIMFQEFRLKFMGVLMFSLRNISIR